MTLAGSVPLREPSAMNVHRRDSGGHTGSAQFLHILGWQSTVIGYFFLVVGQRGKTSRSTTAGH
ncbi:hypothetical protein M5G07_10625 [Serratia symbiotica]|nr:hypothetical protein [Serratia symbiotica]